VTRFKNRMTLVRETERETRATANKPRDYKKKAAYQRENYRRLKQKYVTATPPDEWRLAILTPGRRNNKGLV